MDRSEDHYRIDHEDDRYTASGGWGRVHPTSLAEVTVLMNYPCLVPLAVPALDHGLSQRNRDRNNPILEVGDPTDDAADSHNQRDLAAGLAVRVDLEDREWGHELG